MRRPSKSFLATLVAILMVVLAGLGKRYTTETERRMRSDPGRTAFGKSIMGLSGLDANGCRTYYEFIHRTERLYGPDSISRVPESIQADADRLPIPSSCPTGRLYVCVLERPASLLPGETPLMWDTTPAPVNGAMAVLFWDGSITYPYAEDTPKPFMTAHELKLLVGRLQKKCGEPLKLGFAWKDPPPSPPK